MLQTFGDIRKPFWCLCCFVVLFSSGCKKYLDEKADKQLTQLKTLPDLQALLDDYRKLNWEASPGFGESSADDHFLLLSRYNTISQQTAQAYTWRLTDYVWTNDWSMSYEGIYSANYCLDYIKEIPKTNQNALQWDNIKGSALFHRAIRYLNLIWDYGKAYDDNNSVSDLGVVLRLNSDPSVKSVRSNVKDCYDRAIADAKEAAQYLPNAPQHVMRPSKPAAYGIMARAYLSMRKYDSAYKYADMCLQIKNDLLDYNSSEVNPTGYLSFQPFNKEVIFFCTQSQRYGSKNPYNGYVDTLLYSSYDVNDMRKQVFFTQRNGYHYFKGTYSTVDIEDLFTGIATDEMFLVRAECQARAGKITEAMSDLNTLLSKRWATGTFIPLSASSQQQALNIILTERRKELLMRGLRWIDVKRLNKEGANITIKRVEDQVYTLPPNSDKYALPLPKDIIEITGLPQNTGW